MLRLQWETFFKEGDNVQVHKEHLDVSVDLKGKIASSSNESLALFWTYEENSLGLFRNFDHFIDDVNSSNETFKYWDTFIYLIQQVENLVNEGSSLGPLAFLIYINDLANVVTCNLKLFADGTCLYVTVDDPNSYAAVLNSNLENVKLWADQWLVNFNPKKTKFMTFSNKNVIHPPVHFQNKIIDDVEQHKHLGLTFNAKLNWNDHISNIISSVSKLLDVLQKLSKEIDRKSLEIMYHTFVRSKMEYACIVWDDCSEQNCQYLRIVS